MVKIKICEENKEKISSLIAEIEGRATARTCNYSDVEGLADKAERHLVKFKCPKKYRKGCKASYGELIGVRAYSRIAYHASTTYIYIERGSNAWFYTGAGRETINPSDKGDEYTFNPSEDALKVILKNAEIAFRSL